MQLNTSNLRKARSNWLTNFSFKINERLFRFFLKLSKLKVDFINYDMISTLGKCLIEIDNDSLIKVQLKDLEEQSIGNLAEAEAGEEDLIDSKLTSNFKRLFNVLSNLLIMKNSLFSLTSHHLIKNYLIFLADQLNHDQDFLNELEDKQYLKAPNFLLDLMDRINKELDLDSSCNEHTNSLKIIYFLIWQQPTRIFGIN